MLWLSCTRQLCSHSRPESTELPTVLCLESHRTLPESRRQPGAGAGQLHPDGQKPPATCPCADLELREVLYVYKVEKKFKKKEYFTTQERSTEFSFRVHKAFSEHSHAPVFAVFTSIVWLLRCHNSTGQSLRWRQSDLQDLKCLLPGILQKKIWFLQGTRTLPPGRLHAL